MPAHPVYICSLSVSIVTVSNLCATKRQQCHIIIYNLWASTVWQAFYYFWHSFKRPETLMFPPPDWPNCGLIGLTSCLGFRFIKSNSSNFKVICNIWRTFLLDFIPIEKVSTQRTIWRCHFSMPEVGKTISGQGRAAANSSPDALLPHVNVLRLQIACTAASAQSVRKRRSALNELRLC